MSSTNVELLESRTVQNVDVNVRITITGLNGTIERYKAELRRLADLARGKDDSSICRLLRDIGDVLE